jgi:Zn-dependent protease with chaperone function
MRITRTVLLTLLLAMSAACPALAQGQPRIPTADEVKTLLAKEPINEASWPAWKQRLTDWLGDTSKASEPAYKDAERFLLGLADGNASLPGRFRDDHLAWYLLGYAYLFRQPPKEENNRLAEKVLRRSIEIAPGFARGHRSVALALISQVKPVVNNPQANLGDPRLTEAENALKQAARLDPDLPLAGYEGLIALRRGQAATALAHFEKALQREPHMSAWARFIAECILNDRNVRNPAARIKPLVDRYPEDGALASLYAVGLWGENRMPEAASEFARARDLGTDPALVVGADIVKVIEEAGKPGLFEQFLTIMMWFAITYAGIMVAMAGAGIVLAMKTRGTGALDLLKKQAPEQLVQEGNIARATGETILARLYGFALMIGLILFYAAIPFVIAGLLGATALLLYLIFSMGTIPIKLVVIVFIVGGLSAWAVFKSLFTRPPTGGFGLLKTSEQVPRLHQLLAEVARKVDTDPVNDVFLAPGAGIGVHQEGRGPFGMFGINKRVLTLGFCTLRFLTVGELKAILAHEYAHFSHSDTFYSRFIYQVHMSIEEALYGMKAAGGVITNLNPFYWFLWLYYKSYSLLAAGYSRSREFLADRMAATLYGSAQFKNALEKVSTDGTLFEMTMYNNISALLSEQKAFVNMYEAFTQYRNEQISHDDRNKLYQDLLGEKGSLFASHPTFAERAEAIATLPAVVDPDDRSALELFDRPEEIEQELTKFLTEYMAYMQHLQAQAAAQQQ